MAPSSASAAGSSTTAESLPALRLAAELSTPTFCTQVEEFSSDPCDECGRPT